MLDKYSYDYEWDKEYCYPNSYVLKNKLNIKSQESLSTAEREITSLKIAVAKKNPIWGKFDLVHLQMIHKFIFGDIYTWAGELRHVNISKGNFRFAPLMYLEAAIENVDKMPQGTFDEIVEKYVEMNIIHPFREGNGRTQRVFISQLALNAGYEIDFTNTDTDKLMIATIQAANGVDMYLKEILGEIISPIIKKYIEFSLKC